MNIIERIEAALQDYEQRVNGGTPIMNDRPLELPNDGPSMDEACLRTAVYAVLWGARYRHDKVNVPADALFAKEVLSPANLSRIVESVGENRHAKHFYAEIFFRELGPKLKRAAHLRACATDPKCGDLTFFSAKVLEKMHDTPARLAALSRVFVLNSEDPRTLWRAILHVGMVVETCVNEQVEIDVDDLRRIASHVTDIILVCRELREY